MIAKFKSKALVWGIPGMAMQVLGIAGMFSGAQATEDLDPAFAAVLVYLIGTALLIFGLYFYTLAKSRHAAWALAGFLCLPGFLLVHFLPDASRQAGRKKKVALKKPRK